MIIGLLLISTAVGCKKKQVTDEENGFDSDSQDCLSCKGGDDNKKDDSETSPVKAYSYKELLEDYEWVEQNNYADYAGKYLSIDDVDEDYNGNGRNYITLSADGKFKRNSNYCEGFTEYTGVYTVRSLNDITIITLKTEKIDKKNYMNEIYDFVFEYKKDKLILVASIFNSDLFSDEEYYYPGNYYHVLADEYGSDQMYDCSYTSMFAK